MAPPAARVSVLLALALAPRASLWIAGVHKANYMAGLPYIWECVLKSRVCLVYLD